MLIRSGTTRRAEQLHLLLMESDDDLARRMASVLRRATWSDDTTIRPRSCDTAHVTVVGSLRELARIDLEPVDAVISAVDFTDGSGLDALAYVQGTRLDLPFILAGRPADAQIAAESIRAGSMEFFVITEETIATLPIAVEKAIAHQRIRRENDRLHRELSRSLARLELRNRDYEDMIDRLESKTRTDDLTGLANRRWLNLMLEGAWADACRNDLPLAFLMIDLDGFKQLNDTLGHQRGDDVLRVVGRVLEANCREVDTKARYGGDEFCVLMPHTDPAEATTVAERIRRAFEFAARSIRGEGDDPVRLGMTIGVAHLELSRPANADELVRHADEALYEGKARGRGRVLVRVDDAVVTSRHLTLRGDAVADDAVANA